MAQKKYLSSHVSCHPKKERLKEGNLGVEGVGNLRIWVSWILMDGRCYLKLTPLCLDSMV